jgi:hypothetical protein
MRKRSRTCDSTRVREATPWLPVHDSREEAIAYFSGHVLVHEEVLVAQVKELVVGFMALEGDHVDHLYIAPLFQGGGSATTFWLWQRNCALVV